jgi:hypothetical protein
MRGELYNADTALIRVQIALPKKAYYRKIPRLKIQLEQMKI